MKFKPSLLIACVALLALSGCQTNQDSSAAFTSMVSSAQQRQLDSRKFETSDEILVLNAIVALLQDLGYKLDETNTMAGLVSGSKGNSRNGKMTGSNIKVTVTTTPHRDGGIRVRVTFQDIIAGRDPRFFRAKPVADPAIFVEFFDKLSQSLFLEAHSL